MSLKEAQETTVLLQKQFKSNDKQTTETLRKLKLMLIKLDILLPSNTKKNNTEEMILVREVLEIGALESIRTEDIAGFEIYVAQLTNFYQKELPESPRMYVILGLNLLRLLAQSKISEFHTELERIGSKHIKNPYISKVLGIEQALMEGSYNRVWHARDNVPAPEYKFFMNILMQTIRIEISKCSQKAYKSLPIQDAITLLYLKNEAEVKAFSEQVGWQIKGNTVYFGEEEVIKTAVPTKEVIHSVLDYAMELERIV